MGLGSTLCRRRLVILTAPIIFGGIRRVSKAAEIIVPLMAVLYLVIALFIIATNISLIPDVFGQIFSNAFNFDSAAGGFLGGLISTTMMQGIKRGLYSNEAGMGSAPNAAAAAEVKHPVSQGMIQMLGVFRRYHHRLLMHRLYRLDLSTALRRPERCGADPSGNRQPGRRMGRGLPCRHPVYVCLFNRYR